MTPTETPEAPAWARTTHQVSFDLALAATKHARAFLDGAVAAQFATVGLVCKTRGSTRGATGMAAIATIDHPERQSGESSPIPAHLSFKTTTWVHDLGFEQLYLGGMLIVRAWSGNPLDDNNELNLLAVPKQFTYADVRLPKKTEAETMKHLHAALQAGTDKLFASLELSTYLQRLVQSVT